jgi:hypothetical protein
MQEEVMNAMPRAAVSNAKNGREKPQKAQEQKLHFAIFVLFRGHSVVSMGASWRDKMTQNRLQFGPRWLAAPTCPAIAASRWRKPLRRRRDRLGQAGSNRFGKAPAVAEAALARLSKG